MFRKKNVLMCGIVVFILLCAVPATSFAFWSTTWSSDGKYLKMPFNYYNNPYTSTYAYTTNAYDSNGVKISTIDYAYTHGYDSLGRTINIDDITICKYLTGKGLRRINSTVTGEYKHSSGYSFKENIKSHYYYDSDGYWDSFTTSNSINGKFPGVETFKGIATYPNNQIFFGDSIFPVKITKLSFYRYGVLQAISTFNLQTAYNRKGGRNVIQNNTLKTTTYFANGAYRSSTIKRYDYYDAYGVLQGRKISGTAIGYDKIYGKKAYYKSTITLPSFGKSYSTNYYKEVRTSSSKSLAKIIPYEAKLYNDITRV